jgi:hypothetical protein
VSGNTPTSPAQWLYGLYRALPGERAFLPPSPHGNFPQGLAPASRRQDHTTSPYAFVQSSTEQKRPPHPIPTFGGDGQRPSLGMRRDAYNSDLPNLTSEIFFISGLTRFPKIGSDLPRLRQPPSSEGGLRRVKRLRRARPSCRICNSGADLARVRFCRRLGRAYASGSECSRKKRSISLVASGPRGSV